MLEHYTKNMNVFSNIMLCTGIEFFIAVISIFWAFSIGLAYLMLFTSLRHSLFSLYLAIIFVGLGLWLIISFILDSIRDPILVHDLTSSDILLLSTWVLLGLFLVVVGSITLYKSLISKQERTT